MAWAAPAGLALASIVWLVLHGFVFEPSVAALEQTFAAARTSPADQPVSADATLLLGRIAATPIFALTTGPGAVTEPQILLQGLAITPKGKAALLAIDGKPADWYGLGATRDGVTVLQISPTKVTVDTATRFLEVGLFDKPAAPSANGAAPVKPRLDAVPSGYRSPPPPASAPTQPR
jgi:hypothetical protein